MARAALLPTDSPSLSWATSPRVPVLATGRTAADEGLSKPLGIKRGAPMCRNGAKLDAIIGIAKQRRVCWRYAISADLGLKKNEGYDPLPERGESSRAAGNFRRMERIFSSKGAAATTASRLVILCLVALGHVEGFLPVGPQLMPRRKLGGAGVCGMRSTVGRRSQGGRHHGSCSSGFRCAIIDQEDELSMKVWSTSFPKNWMRLSLLAICRAQYASTSDNDHAKCW